MTLGASQKPYTPPTYHLVRLEEGRDRYTVLPHHFRALDEARAQLEQLAHQEPQGRFVIQLSGLA